MSAATELYGVVAEFASAETLVDAVKRARAQGYRQVQAYTPYPVEGLAEAAGLTRDRVPLLVLLGGAAGAAGAFFLQWYAAVVDYPVNIGGRPLFSWPAFIPITAEVTFLGAAVVGVVGALLLNGLPKFYHPVFSAPGFEHATADRFFLCIEARESSFDVAQAEQFLKGLAATSINRVEH